MSYQEIKEQSILVICLRYLDTLFRENLARGKNEIFGAAKKILNLARI